MIAQPHFKQASIKLKMKLYNVIHIHYLHARIHELALQIYLPLKKKTPSMTQSMTRISLIKALNESIKYYNFNVSIDQNKRQYQNSSNNKLVHALTKDYT